MDLAQELLINVQCSSVLTSFAKETRALKMRSTVASYWKLTTSNWEDHWSWSSDNYMRSCWRTQWYSMVVQHLKQTGKAKKLDKWMAHEFTKKKKKESFVLKCHLLLFSATTTNHFLIKLWCAIKSVFLYDNQEWPAHCLDQETPKHCQSQTCTKKKVTGHCLVVCCWNDPLQLSESQWNHYIWEVCSKIDEMHWKLQYLQLALANRKGPILLHDNTQLHIAHPTLQKFDKLG